MKLLSLPLFASVMISVSSASGATNVSYTASADPNLNPDSNNNTVDAWTVSHSGDTAGASTTYSGSYYASGTGAGMLGTAWAIYSDDNYTPTTAGSYTSEEDQNSTFVGGALSVGQTLSINFLANTVDTGNQYGIRLTNNGAFVLSLSFIGGGAGYGYYDGSTNGNIAFGYQANGFNFAYTQNTATTYTVVATPIGGGAIIGTFSGMVSGAPTTIQIYNESAGTNNNVLTNNLVIVPEPSSFVFLAGSGLGVAFLCLRRRSVRSAA